MSVDLVKLQSPEESAMADRLVKTCVEFDVRFWTGARWKIGRQYRELIMKTRDTRGVQLASTVGDGDILIGWPVDWTDGDELRVTSARAEFEMECAR